MRRGTLRAEVCRQAAIFEGTTNHLMMETSRVRDAAKYKIDRLSGNWPPAAT